MKCVKCGKEATRAYSPDIDIKGLGTCEECKEDVGLAYLMIIQRTPEMVNDYTKDWFSPFNL